MHPVEAIRWALGHSGSDPAETATVVASALAHMSGPERTLSARRVVERRLHDPVLRWACSRVLCALDPIEAAAEVETLLWTDDTAEETAAVPRSGAVVSVVGVGHRGIVGGRVAEALFDLRPDLDWVGDPDEADVVLCEPVAAGAAGVLVAGRDAGAVTEAGDRLLVVVSRGRALPDPFLAELADADGWSLVAAPPQATIVGPDGPTELPGPPGLAALVDCPLAPELLTR